MPYKNREEKLAYQKARYARRSAQWIKDRLPLWPGHGEASTRASSVAATDAAYVAGLFDGEGCLTTFTVEGRRPRLAISISGAYRETLDWLRTIYGGHVRANRNGGTNKMVYVWNPGSIPEQLVFLEAVRPFLREKASQADAALGFLRVRIGQPRRGLHAKNAETDEMALRLRESLSGIKRERATALQGTTAAAGAASTPVSPEESRLL